MAETRAPETADVIWMALAAGGSALQSCDMTQYRLNDPRQGLIGPVRLETVRDLVSAGVIQDDVLVSKDGGEWLPVKSFAEVFGQPHAVGTQKAAYAGDIGKNSSFFRVFYRFHLAKETGLLTIKDPPRHKDIYLENGRPVFVDSNLEAERIGEFLVRSTRLSASDLAKAVEAGANDDHQLGAILGRLGLMQPGEFMRAVVEQQTERLVDLCRWHAGQYLFFARARFLGEKLDLNLVPLELILAAARSMDAPLLAERLSPHVHAVVTRLPHTEIDHGAISLAPGESRALALIDGHRTVAEIIKATNDAGSRRAAFCLLYLLWEIDAASFTPVS